MKKKISFFIVHSKELFKKYSGKFIAVVDEKVVAIGKNRKEVFEKAIAKHPKIKEIGIYYLPRKEELVTALWTFQEVGS